MLFAILPPDDLRYLFAGAESHPVQALFRYLHQLHPPNALHAIHLWLPRGLHPLQMERRLVEVTDCSYTAAQHVDIDVPLSRIGRSRYAVIRWSGSRSSDTTSNCVHLHPMVVDLKAVFAIQRGKEN